MVDRLYDPACGELARYFLSEEAHTEEQVRDLAGDIQEAIEDWFLFHPEMLHVVAEDGTEVRNAS